MNDSFLNLSNLEIGFLRGLGKSALMVLNSTKITMSPLRLSNWTF